MKQNNNSIKTPAKGVRLIPVQFEFTHPTATSVCVAGCFNQWQPEAKSPHPSGEGRWIKETVLPPGTYEYCLVVDGEWMPDPQAKDYVPNPYGGRNSVLSVPASREAAHLADAENLPLKSAARQKIRRTSA